MQRSKLTLYIFIALILGVIAGYLYNVYVINAINTRITTAQTAIKGVNASLSGFKDTTGIDYKMLATQKSRLAGHIKANQSLRED